ncbi:MAG: signal peptidase I [Verrucomicrobiales bacterium]|nr:signal peptidase I [Verrucomicrobiales bacterium]
MEKVRLLKTDLQHAADGKLDTATAKLLFEQTPARLEKLWAGCTKSNPWAENIEVIFVALIVAFALRCYFVQPFKIPTDSMKPTLWGIYREPTNTPKPNPLKQLFNYAVGGRSYHALTAPADGRIESIKPGASFLFIGTTKVRFAGEEFTLWTDYENTIRALAIQQGIPNNELSTLASLLAARLANTTFRKGETIASFTVDAGDHLFVNKVAYNFRLPRQGEVFVFTTKGIAGLHNQTRGITQYYIKRCVGIPGATLRIDPPYLYSNGEILHSSAIDRIYSKQNGYNGYFSMGWLGNADAEISIPADKFWAMGDNSANSLDSRYWKYVPRENLVGTALVVYWPFTKRWGFIQ